jgi:FtsH-binding integral membrane protein
LHEALKFAQLPVCAPSQKFFFLGAPLSMGLTSVALASFMSSMIPSAELVRLVEPKDSRKVHSFSLYGGLVVFGGYLLLDANTLNTRARNVKEVCFISCSHYSQFDPVDECIHLYLDIANLFVRVLEILVDQKREEEKKKREKPY